jgi:hypothetical protein
MRDIPGGEYQAELHENNVTTSTLRLLIWDYKNSIQGIGTTIKQAASGREPHAP